MHPSPRDGGKWRAVVSEVRMRNDVVVGISYQYLRWEIQNVIAGRRKIACASPSRKLQPEVIFIHLRDIAIHIVGILGLGLLSRIVYRHCLALEQRIARNSL